MLGWMTHKLESKLPGEISTTSYMQMTPLLWQTMKRNQRTSWWRWESTKASLKLNIHKTKIMASDPITSWEIDGKIVETVTIIFLVPKISADCDCNHKITRHLLLGRKAMPDLESEVAQSYLTLCDPMDCSLPGSTIHGIFQARILEWVAIPFSRRSSQPRDWTQVSHIVGRRFTIWATREVIAYMISLQQTLFSVVKNWKHSP